MSSRIYPVKYKQVEILYTDWRNLCEPKEFIEAIHETSGFVVEQAKTGLLEIVDMRGCFFSLDIFKELKEAALRTKPYNAHKAIVVDLSASRLLMLRFLNSFSNEKIVAFPTLEEAQDWIVLQRSR